MRILCFLVVVLLAVALPAYQPGDVNGDGTVDADDLACVVNTVYDPQNGCAAATATPVGNLLSVGLSGGDFQSVQAAVDSISDAAADNPYMVFIGPGEFAGPVLLKQHVHLQGAGRGVTVLVVQGGTALTMTAYTSARDLSVRCEAGASSGRGLLVPPGASAVEISDVAVESSASSMSHALEVDAASALLSNVDAESLSGGISGSVGCAFLNGAVVTLRGGSCAGRGGSSSSVAAEAYDAGTAVEAEGTVFVAQSSSGSGSYGLSIADTAEVVLRGGRIAADGGVNAHGIYAQGSARIDASGVSVKAANGLSTSTAVLSGGAYCWLRGCKLSGGTYAVDAGANLTALAECQLEGAVTSSGGANFICRDTWRLQYNIITFDWSFVDVSCP